MQVSFGGMFQRDVYAAMDSAAEDFHELEGEQNVFRGYGNTLYVEFRQDEGATSGTWYVFTGHKIDDMLIFKAATPSVKAKPHLGG